MDGMSEVPTLINLLIIILIMKANSAAVFCKVTILIKNFNDTYFSQNLSNKSMIVMMYV